MKAQEFEQLLQLHGFDIDRWPDAGQQATAAELLKQSAEARRLQSEYRQLDAALESWQVPDFPDLQHRILTAGLPAQPRSLFDRFVTWLLPENEPSALLWRPISAACLPLVAGILFGNVFSFGVERESVALESWEDEFILLALNDIAGPAGLDLELQP